MTTEKILNLIRYSNAVCSYIPMEAVMGLPIPVNRNKKLCVGVPFFDNNENIHIITADFDDALIVEYKNLNYCDDDIEEVLCDLKLKDMEDAPPSEYLNCKYEILKLYDKYFECLKSNIKHEGEWHDNLCNLFLKLADCSHLKYYNYINKQFFEEMQNIKKA